MPIPETYQWTFGRGVHRIQRTFEVRVDDTQNLDSGDYLLAGFESLARIERKGSVSELMQNLFTADRARFERSIKRLVESCKYPYLLLDMPHRAFLCDPYVKDTNEVMDEVWRFAAWKGLRPLAWNVGNDVAARKQLGLTIVRCLWSHAWEDLVRRQRPENKL